MGRTYKEGLELEIRSAPNGSPEWVLYEYWNGDKAKEPTCPVPSWRGFYRRGDVVLVRNLSRRMMQLYAEDWELDFGGTVSLVELLAEFFGAKQTVGSILVDFREGGYVTTKPVWVLGGDVFPLNRQRSITVDRLETDFIYYRFARDKKVASDVGQVLAEISAAVVTAGGGAAAGATLRRAFRPFRRKALRRLGVLSILSRLRALLGQKPAEVARAAGQAALRAFMKRMAAEQLRATAAARAGNAGLANRIETQSHRAAARDAAAAFMTKLLSAALPELGPIEALLSSQRPGKDPANWRAWVVPHLFGRMVAHLSEFLETAVVEAWKLSESADAEDEALAEKLGEALWEEMWLAVIGAIEVGAKATGSNSLQ